MSENEKGDVWVVRDPSGVRLGAAIERRVVEGCVHYGDGVFAALENARVTTSDHVRRRLEFAAENNASDRYEQDGYTLALETLMTPAHQAVIAAAKALDLDVFERITQPLNVRSDVNSEVAKAWGKSGLTAAVAALRAQEGA